MRGVTGMIRGLMTNAIDAGAVRIETGLNREEDVLLPRLSACPVSCGYESPRVGGDRGGRHCSTERILLTLPQILLAVRIGVTVSDFCYV